MTTNVGGVMDLQEDRETLKLFIDNAQLPSRVRIEGLEGLATRLGNRVIATRAWLSEVDNAEIQEIISEAVAGVWVIRQKRI